MASSGAATIEVGRFDASDVRARLDSGLVFAPGATPGRRRPGRRPDPDGRGAGRASTSAALDLVVLSACSTGLGRIRAGQGLVGLLGALDRAGAGAVVCSLWEVDDEPTAALMTAFYRAPLGRRRPGRPGPRRCGRRSSRLIRDPAETARRPPRSPTRGAGPPSSSPATPSRCGPRAGDAARPRTGGRFERGRDARPAIGPRGVRRAPRGDRSSGSPRTAGSARSCTAPPATWTTRRLERGSRRSRGAIRPELIGADRASRRRRR